jgi:hypothetical protein
MKNGCVVKGYPKLLNSTRVVLVVQFNDTAQNRDLIKKGHAVESRGVPLGSCDMTYVQQINCCRIPIHSMSLYPYRDNYGDGDGDRDNSVMSTEIRSVLRDRQFSFLAICFC